MKHGNIGIFIPHLGCPHDCVFCNQKHISGTAVSPQPDDVRRILAEAVENMGTDHDCEIAFFGGSFTAIERDYMTALLDAANEYSRYFCGIRVSTRPDCINEEVLSVLKEKGVTDIELGVQSMDNAVLMRSCRGHAAEDTVRASELIHSFKIGLGHQMMTGLPGDSPEGALMTAREIAAISPDTVRIYPTLVVKDTALARMYRRGEYRPQTVEEAVSLCAELILIFDRANVRVIRTGLHPDVENSVIAGPYHPAFGELCESRIYRNQAETLIESRNEVEGKLLVNPTEISKMTGQHRENLNYLSRKFGVEFKVLPDPSLNKREIRVI